jgi:hypothetical protein
MPRRSATWAIGTGRSPERASSASATTAYRDFEVTEITDPFYPMRSPSEKSALFAAAVATAPSSHRYDREDWPGRGTNATMDVNQK